MTRLFITRPQHDKGTYYLYIWSKKIIDSAEDHGWIVNKSDGPKATRAEVQSRLEKNSADFVFFNGHGNESEMSGHNLETILDESSSHLLKNTITFTRACNCVVKLGKSAVDKGCKSFIGYAGKFWIPRIHKFELTPLKDMAAKPVLEVSNQIPLSIIKNCTASEAVDSARALTIKYISKLILSREPYNRAALKALSQNDDSLAYKGNGDAKIG
ncbi:hypothetical protein KKG83_02160 [Candidatus Micrarchaeota archaeon]|nr:hypothetical protein [Candidatus Micrarchaeota archaeon]